ncbi:MAG: nucleotidyltransferase domain-containing protein [Alphaproteobacteria bacterium]|nr:nucleotidyltransferase domain-containing protein [Alphaproteobacteria bacterium]
MTPDELEARIQEVTAWAVATYDPLGVVVCGSLVRGEGCPHSDLDVVVVHRLPWRLREQRRFTGVPAEIFVNPPATVRRYLRAEAASGRPSMAHMLAHGRIMPGADAEVVALVEEARRCWEEGPPPVDGDATRYGVVDLLDDARDLRGVDELGEWVLLSRVLVELAAAVARLEGRWPPSRKRAVGWLRSRDATCAALIDAFAAAPPAGRLEPVAALCRHLLGVDTFFAWRSAPDPQETS